ncbi:MAG TPA: hypothetical protein VJQ56_11095 [Blastocatellia bacterium]|nr:hypothetical protein [Blastocatellia bacterium]
MMFSLDVIRARKGDCLILHYGSEDDPRLVMIDGGPSGVYGPHLKPRLDQIRQARGLEKAEPLTVDLLMVSHVDDDHIKGILDLTKELIEAKSAQKPQRVQVLSLWHNSFDNIIGNTPDELTAAFKSQFGPASIEGQLPDDATLDDVDEAIDEKTIFANLKVLSSIAQGAQLRSDVENLDFPLNPEFDGELIIAREKGEAIDMGEGLEFTVVGPMIGEVKKLHAKHQAWLKELEKEGLSPEDVLSAYVDPSVPNLSSIVVLAEADKKRMLLTGDARGDKILEGLELVGLLKKNGKMRVDLLKVPHHGSSNNLALDFFKRVTADHYVFSGDGEHGNPERESLEMLLAARGNARYTIHLTYPIDEIDSERKKDWEKEQAKEKKKKEKDPKQKVRPKWSPKKHSLAALFKDNPNFGKKVRIVEADKPHLIDLLDEVGF